MYFTIHLKMSKILVILLSGAAVIFAVYYYTARPFPIVLDDPPFPEGVIINNEERSTRIWYSGNNPSSKTYIWQKEYVVGLLCCEELNSSEKIFSFLDEWMSIQGWVRWEEIGSPCANMNETDFLDSGTGFVSYVPKGTKTLWNSPSVCIAVWPLDDEVFSVLLLTSDH